jgi:hypothetical protein
MMSEETLESVFLSFQQWRSQRTNRAERIPERLWAMAMRLYPQHKISQICQQLGLSGSQLKQRIEKSTGDLSNCGFVLASTDADVLSPQPTTEVVLGIEGQRRTLTLEVNIDALSKVLPYVEALL